MKLLSIGPCPVCEKTIYIMDKGKLKITEDGTHFWIKSNHGTIAKFAICKECLEKLDMPKVAEIIDRQVLTWIAELLKSDKPINRKLFCKYRFYAAVKFANTEEEVLES